MQWSKWGPQTQPTPLKDGDSEDRERSAFLSVSGRAEKRIQVSCPCLDSGPQQTAPAHVAALCWALCSVTEQPVPTFWVDCCTLGGGEGGLWSRADLASSLGSGCRGRGTPVLSRHKSHNSQRPFPCGSDPASLADTTLLGLSPRAGPPKALSHSGHLQKFCPIHRYS